MQKEPKRSLAHRAFFGTWLVLIGLFFLASVVFIIMYVVTFLELLSSGLD